MARLRSAIGGQRRDIIGADCKADKCGETHQGESFHEEPMITQSWKQETGKFADVARLPGNRGVASGSRSRKNGPMSEQRFNFFKAAPEAYKAMSGVETYLRGCGLEEGLLHLVKMRASQINGCAFCLDMHSKDLRALGETEQRLYTLPAWRECPWFNERERAALAWTEALTLVTEGHVPDAVYEEARQHFNEKELTDLSIAITTINAWNRLSIAARTTPGSYKAKTS